MRSIVAVQKNPLQNKNFLASYKKANMKSSNSSASLEVIKVGVFSKKK